MALYTSKFTLCFGSPTNPLTPDMDVIYGWSLAAVLALVPAADLAQGGPPGGDVGPEDALGLPVEVDGDGVGLVVHEDLGGAVEGGQLDVVAVGEEQAHGDFGVSLAVRRIVLGRD